jgi:hypothetical protein
METPSDKDLRALNTERWLDWSASLAAEEAAAVLLLGMTFERPDKARLLVFAANEDFTSEELESLLTAAAEAIRRAREQVN